MSSGRCKGPTFVKDKGYAWVVLLMSFLSYFAHLGFYTGTVGNLTIVHQNFFNIDLQLSSLIGTVHGGTVLMFGPIASILVKKLGCRASEIIGGTCTLVGVGLSYFSTQPWHAFILYSFLSAVGISIVYVTSSEILALSFDKFKYSAFSIAVIGQYVGKATLATVSQKLFEMVGYSQAMAILSTFHVLHIVSGIFFFEPSEESGTDASRSARPTTDDEIEQDAGQLKEGVGELPAAAYINQAADVIEDENTEQNPNGNIENSVGDEEENNMNRKLRQSETDSSSLRTKFVTLLKQPKVWAFLVNACLWNSNLITVLVLLNDYIVGHIQVSAAEAALGVTIIGVTNLLGCVGVTVISLLKFDRVILHLFFTAFMGGFTIVIAFSVNKLMFYVTSALFGFAQGALLANLLGVVNDLIKDTSLLALLFGLELFGEGVGAIAGTSLFSYVAKIAGAQYGIILAGCAGIASSLCLLPVVIQRVLKRKRQSCATNDDTSQHINTKL